MSVPKIIHQLWIGDKEMPINAMNSVKNMNSDYKYMFWCEKTIEENLNIKPRYQRKIDEHTAIWGKADMYRYFILEQYGGIFVDADMVCIEPFDDFLLSSAFFCWENEIMRPNLCATSLQGYPPNHIIPKSAIEWIMNNNVNIEKTRIDSWKLVGPGLLTKTYWELIPDKSVVNVLPSYTALPDHHTGTKYKGHGKVYMTHEWGSTKNNYNEINVMNIPAHHRPPTYSIDIEIPNNINNKKLKEVIQSIKKMEGHFYINIKCDKDISKYLKSMRFVKQNNNISLILNDLENEKHLVFDTRKEMIKFYSDKIDKPKILELGVFKGEFLNYMVENLDYGSIEGVDLFNGIVDSGDEDGNNVEYVNLERQHILLNDKYRDNENVNVYKSYTSTYLTRQPDNYYDIIYIDADHSYEGARTDILLAHQKIKLGGYIMGHDYEMNMDKAKTFYHFGVRQAVDEYCERYNQKIIAKGMNGCVSFCIKVDK